MTPCFICKRTVLPLEGQYDVLDTVLLHPSDDALIRSAYGLCHLQCLVQSEWGMKWSFYRQRHLTGLKWMSVISETSEMRVFLNTQNNNLSFFDSKGVDWTFHPLQANRIGTTAAGEAIRKYSGECNLHLRDHHDLAQAVSSKLELEGEYSFLRLATELGIADRVMHPEILAMSKILFGERSADSRPPGWIVGKHVHYEWIPQGVIECARKFFRWPSCRST